MTSFDFSRSQWKWNDDVGKQVTRTLCKVKAFCIAIVVFFVFVLRPMPIRQRRVVSSCCWYVESDYSLLTISSLWIFVFLPHIFAFVWWRWRWWRVRNWSTESDTIYCAKNNMRNVCKCKRNRVCVLLLCCWVLTTHKPSSSSSFIHRGQPSPQSDYINRFSLFLFFHIFFRSLSFVWSSGHNVPFPFVQFVYGAHDWSVSVSHNFFLFFF